MLNIVIPMAGRGSRFVEAGYKTPKPLLPILGVPLIAHVVANLKPSSPHRFIFICQKFHKTEYSLSEILGEWLDEFEIIELNEITEGAACSVLMARNFINNDNPLMIANSDQWVDCEIDSYLGQMELNRYDGLIMTMKASHPKWSYARLNEDGQVIEVVEKKVVSDEATVGIYNFARGREFVSFAEQMIRKNLRVNGEFYVAPVYNEFIEAKKRIGIHNIGSERFGMYGLGIPEDYEWFIKSPMAMKALSLAEGQKRGAASGTAR